MLANRTTISFSSGTALHISKTDAEYPQKTCLHYSEKDRDISGRLWVTEIGICKNEPDSEIECTFLVETKEISINVPLPEQMTRPWVIREILKRCKPSKSTFGLNIIDLDDVNLVKAFDYEINRPDRKYPIILVSPTVNESYLVDFFELHSQTIGSAQIVRIPIGADTFEIADILGKYNSAYNGAINLLFPVIKKGDMKYVPTRLLLPEAIEEIRTGGKSIEREILGLLAHRMNLPNYWRHISPESVKESQREREIKNLRQKAKETGDLQQYIELLEEDSGLKQDEINKLLAELNSSQNESNYYSDEYDKVNEELLQSRNKVTGLQAQLESMKIAREKRSDLEDCSEELRILTDEYISKNITPYESLELISRFFPDRVVVLDSAFRASKVSQGFKEKRFVFELLWKLATDYWQALTGGQGDTEARQIFGDNYSAREAMSLSTRGRKLRTFTYNGEEIEMMKHLKYGVKDSPAETIRIHFEWFSDEQKFVIGYCGPHIPFD